MRNVTPEWDEEARAEAEAAAAWYAARNEAVALDFLAEIDRAVVEIVAAPKRWSRGRGGERRYILHRFPYRVVYRETDSGIEIVAVAHASRRPRYWRHR